MRRRHLGDQLAAVEVALVDGRAELEEARRHALHLPEGPRRDVQINNDKNITVEKANDKTVKNKQNKKVTKNIVSEKVIDNIVAEKVINNIDSLNVIIDKDK